MVRKGSCEKNPSCENSGNPAISPVANAAANKLAGALAEVARFAEKHKAGGKGKASDKIKALDVDGRKVHTVGIPIHWGFKGVTQNGYLANALTPFVGDANSQTPEFKAFLVNIEKA